MKTIRRITTGVDAHSQESLVVEELLPVPITGPSRHCIWAADSPPVVPNDGTAPPFAGPVVPMPGGVNLLQLTLPPLFRRGPDAMHSTPTVDCVLQLEGESVLVRPDREVTLSPGDWLVCNGLLHDWRNDNEIASTLLAVIYGALTTQEE